MTAAHLFASDVSADHVTVDGDDARHAVRVLRLRAGERVTISDGYGSVVDAVVSEAGRTLVADVLERRTVPRPAPSVTLVQGIPKGSKLGEIVQHVTELGVDRIVPLRAKRSVAKWDGPEKVARLRTIAREASKQSRRAWLPHVSVPLDIREVPVEGLGVVLHEESTAGLRAILPAQAPEAVTLFVGPEGGFDPEEVEWLESQGVRPARLGPLILRTETAGLAAVTLVMGQFGRFD